MKRILLTLLFIICTFSSAFAQINDNLNLFTEEEKEQIDRKILEIEDARKLKIVVNSLPEGEGFVAKAPERIIVLNISAANSSCGVNLNFSRDIQIEDYIEDINLILGNAKELLEEKKYSEYVNELLSEIDDILFDIDVENEMDIIREQEAEKTKKTWNIWNIDIKKALIIGGILMAIGALGLALIEFIIKLKNDKYDKQAGIFPKKKFKRNFKER